MRQSEHRTDPSTRHGVRRRRTPPRSSGGASTPSPPRVLSCPCRPWVPIAVLGHPRRPRDRRMKLPPMGGDGPGVTGQRDTPFCPSLSRPRHRPPRRPRRRRQPNSPLSRTANRPSENLPCWLARLAMSNEKSQKALVLDRPDLTGRVGRHRAPPGPKHSRRGQTPPLNRAHVILRRSPSHRLLHNRTIAQFLHLPPVFQALGSNLLAEPRNYYEVITHFGLSASSFHASRPPTSCLPPTEYRNSYERPPPRVPQDPKKIPDGGTRLVGQARSKDLQC